MKPSETSSAPSRGAGLLALVVAALALSATETVYAWAERWNHPPSYFVLSAGLTLALAGSIGLVGTLLGLGPGLALTAWVGVCFGLHFGWIAGLSGAVAAFLALRTRVARTAPPIELGVGAGVGLACAYLKCTSLAEHLGQKGDLVLESIGATLLIGLVLAGLFAALARLSGRCPMSVRVPGLLLVACLLALRPRLDRGDGQHRLPPEGYARSEPRVPGNAGPGIIVLVLDTVRADHLSVYGYERDTCPEIDRMVQTRSNAVVYPRALANGTWTVPSHGSLFTGRLPNEHGAHFARDGAVRVGFGIADALPTVSEELRNKGYATLASYANHWLRSVKGMGRGFDRYLRAPDRDELPFVGESLRQRFYPGVMWEATKGCARATEVNATLLSMLEPWSQGPNPLFVFANYVDAHGPYAPPFPFRGRFAETDNEELSEHLDLEQSVERRAQLMARYDEEIAYLDSQLGELFREMERLDILRNSWIFITSDHGEAFGEHGVLEHGTSVHNEVVHVPLIVFPPDGIRLPVTNDPVSLVDVAATVAAIAGSDLPGPGRDLRSLSSTGTQATVIEFYGDSVKAKKLGALAKRPARSVVVGHHKLIAYSDSFHLYDLDADPGEHVDLAGALPELVERMKVFLPEFREPTFRSDSEAPVPEALDALRGLGYAGG